MTTKTSQSLRPPSPCGRGDGGEGELVMQLPSHSRRSPLGLSLLLAAAGLFLAAGLASAHAGYSRSEPGAGAIVAAAPARLDVWFTQDLFRRAGENWLHVAGPDGAEVTAAEAVIDDDDRR